MRRFLIAACVLSHILGATLHGQAPAFEVATVKRNTSDSLVASNQLQPGGRLTMRNRSLENIIREVYGFQTYQVSGGADWVRTERWDIVAKAEGDPSFEQVLAMVKTLLSDRFQLVAHTEPRDMPVYALQTTKPDGRLGPLVKASAAHCPTDCRTNMSAGRIVATGRTMTDIARNLSAVAGRAVVDRTGLTATFDLELTWNDTDQGPSLFTAVQEQLGLKLEPQRGQVPVFVIDSAQRPAAE